MAVNRNSVVEIVQQVLENVGSATKLITISGAARKYNIPLKTVSQWAARGDIAVISRLTSGRREVLLDENSVARAAEAYHLQPGRGYRPLNILKKTTMTP